MPPKLEIMNQGTFYWRYSDRDPEWKVLKKYDTEIGLTCEAKLVKKEEINMAKFEIGDKVKVVKLDCKWDGWVDDLSKYIGRTGAIKEFRYGCIFAYAVQFEDDWWVFPEDWLELVEKAKKYWSGTVVCVSSDSEAYFVKGKAYKVKNGRIFGENHSEFQTSYTEPTTELDLCEMTCCPMFPINRNCAKFIEYKGMAGE